MNDTPQRPLLPVEKEYLIKERANVLDRLAFIERRLGLPPSVLNKQQRRAMRREGVPNGQPDNE